MYWFICLITHDVFMVITVVYAVGTSQIIKSAVCRILEALRKRHGVWCILKGISAFIEYEFKNKLCVFYVN